MSAEYLDLPWPWKGRAEGDAFGHQHPLTTRSARNMRSVDPVTGRMRGSKRSGRTSYTTVAAQANGANKIKRIESLTIDNKAVTYALLAPASEEQAWSSSNETKTDCFGIQVDGQSNVYALDSTSGAAKYNSENKLLWKISFPVSDPKHVLRAFHVDAFGGIYAGVSAGGDSLKSRLWKYHQVENDKTEVVWQTETGGYVEQVKRKDSLLYTLQNFPESATAFMVVYSEIDAPTPEEVMRWQVPYPGNDFDIGPKDGSVFVACEPNARRGLDPRSPHTTAQQIDYVPEKHLANYQSRVWAHYKASDLESLVILPKSGGDELSGGEVKVWIDRSGKGRHLYAPTILNTGGPTWRRVGMGGLPAIKFSGKTPAVGVVGQYLESTAGGSLTRSNREDSLTMLPGYVGAQFACIAAVRFPIEATPRYLISSGTAERALIVNRANGTGVALPMPGHVQVFESVSGAMSGVSDPSSSTPATNATGGVGGYPLGQSVGPYGHAIITWIHDGGIHDVFGTASRSLLRVNGQPADRWQSAVFSTLNATQLGTGLIGPIGPLGLFVGEVSEILVLSDWDNADGVLQPLLVHTPATRYPDIPFSSPMTIGSELEQLEGAMAAEYGLAHLLPGGQAGILTLTGNVTNTDTVVIDSTTYRFMTVPAAQNDIDIGATAQATLLNLQAAMNHTGTPGVDYFYSTVAHPTFYAVPPVPFNATPQHSMAIYSRSSYSGAATTTNPLDAGGVITWTTGATTVTSFDGAGGNRGHYPHAFHLNKTPSLTLGSPPSADTLGTRGKRGDLNSVYGILAKYDPANGNLKWVATTNADNNGLPLSAVGYAVRINSVGEVYSAGPRQAAVTLLGVVAENFDVRKLLDQGTTYAITPAGSALADAWTAAPASATGWTYKYPRMDVDKFDNLYVPYHNTADETKTALVYQRQPAAGVGVVLVTLNNLTDDPQAHAVAVDRQIPDYQVDLSQSTSPIAARAEYIFVATRNETASNKTTLYRIRLVSTTPIAGATRTQLYLAASGTSLLSFTTAGYTSLGTPFSSGAKLIDSCTLLEKAYFVDGKKVWVVNPKGPLTVPPIAVLSELVSITGGKVPARCQLVAAWGSRLVFARDPDDPQNWYMPARGKPDDFDYFPPSLKDGIAIKGNDSRVGVCPDIINAIVPWNQDVLIFGGVSTIQALYGDPTTENAQYGLVTDATGMAFGPSWDKDERGTLYFVGSRGGLFAMTGPNAEPEPLHEEQIPRFLRNLDFANYYVQAVWNARDEGLHVFVLPFGAGGGEQVEHWFWHRVTGQLAPWPDLFPVGLQPTSAKVIDGDLVGSRILLMGTEDGQILKWDETAANDGTLFGGAVQAIDASVLIGPETPADSPEWYRFFNLRADLADSQQGCGYEWFASPTADTTGSADLSGTFVAGQNPFQAEKRLAGSYVWLRLFNATAGQRFSIEMLGTMWANAGRRRIHA